MAVRVRYEELAKTTPTHPSWRRRVDTTIATLDGMSRLDIDQTVADTYRITAEWLAARWADLTRGQPPSGVDDGRVRTQATDLVTLLAAHALPRLRYDITGPVDQLCDGLDQPGAGVPAGATPAHVLNAAWRWRLSNPATDDA